MVIACQTTPTCLLHHETTLQVFNGEVQFLLSELHELVFSKKKKLHELVGGERGRRQRESEREDEKTNWSV